MTDPFPEETSEGATVAEDAAVDAMEDSTDSLDDPTVEGLPLPESPAEEAAAGGIDIGRFASVVESLLLVSAQPLSFEKIGHLLGGVSKGEVREVVAALQEKYPPGASGILVEEVAKGVQFRTNPANQEYVRRLFDVKPPRFSRAALETLAIVAYKQPVTRLEMEQIRGVDCAGSLKTLMERRLVRVVGKKDVPGKPFLFGTSREFLEVFGLANLSDLPSLRDIEDFLAAASGGIVPEGSGEAALQGEAPAHRREDELTESLEGAGALGPPAPSSSGFPEGVSDDVLAGAASMEGAGEEEPDGE